jgi:hypothetical protein
VSDYGGSQGMKLLILENHDPLFQYYPDKDPDELVETFEEMLDEMLRLHAHELAEKIRALVTHPGDYTCLPCQAHLFDADLIDPEVDK